MTPAGVPSFRPKPHRSWEWEIQKAKRQKEGKTGNDGQPRTPRTGLGVAGCWNFGVTGPLWDREQSFLSTLLEKAWTERGNLVWEHSVVRGEGGDIVEVMQESRGTLGQGVPGMGSAEGKVQQVCFCELGERGGNLMNGRQGAGHAASEDTSQGPGEEPRAACGGSGWNRK